MQKLFRNLNWKFYLKCCSPSNILLLPSFLFPATNVKPASVLTEIVLSCEFIIVFSPLCRVTDCHAGHKVAF